MQVRVLPCQRFHLSPMAKSLLRRVPGKAGRVRLFQSGGLRPPDNAAPPLPPLCCEALRVVLRSLMRGVAGSHRNPALPPVLPIFRFITCRRLDFWRRGKVTVDMKTFYLHISAAPRTAVPIARFDTMITFNHV